MQRTGGQVASPAATPSAPLATVQLTLPGTDTGNGSGTSKTTNVQFSVPKLVGKKKPTKFTGKSLYVRIQGLMRRLQPGTTEDPASSDLAYLQDLVSLPDSAMTSPDPTLTQQASSSSDFVTEGSEASQQSQSFKVNQWRCKTLAEFDALPAPQRKVYDDMADSMYAELCALYTIKERPSADQRAA